MDRHLMADPAVSGCLWLWKFKYPLHVLVKFIQFSLKNDEFGGGHVQGHFRNGNLMIHRGRFQHVVDSDTTCWGCL